MNTYTARLRKRMPAGGDFDWDDEWHDNQKIDDVVAGALLSANRVISGGAVTDGGGLTANFAAAVVRLNGVQLAIDAGSLVMSPAAAGTDVNGNVLTVANWVYVDSAGDMVTALVPPSGVYIPHALVDTDNAGIVRIADLRPMDGLSKDASGGVPGLTEFAINFMNALGTIKSFFTNANTAPPRTYTFQNRNGVIADDTDLALKAPLNSPVFTTSARGPTPASADDSDKFATTAWVRDGDTLVNSANGYRIWRDGFVEQWGVDVYPGGSVSRAVSFPIAFTNLRGLFFNGNVNQYLHRDAAVPPTVNGFSYYGGVGTQTVYWIAVGYILPA